MSEGAFSVGDRVYVLDSRDRVVAGSVVDVLAGRYRFRPDSSGVLCDEVRADRVFPSSLAAKVSRQEEALFKMYTVRDRLAEQSASTNKILLAATRRLASLGKKKASA
jgi:hypothetical protein